MASDYQTFLQTKRLAVQATGRGVTSNGGAWRWIARRVLDSKTLAASKPFPAAEPAKDEAVRWLRDQEGKSA